MLTLTLVIPVYNEERHIRGCLKSIRSQTVQPDEVIVVDNNCTDQTISIVRHEYPTARIITEKRQGRGHAREAGFSAATCDIVGRIDADSRLNPDWVERVKTQFESDKSLDGITGLGRTAFLPFLNKPKSTLPSRSYYWFAHAGFGTVTMWGATMAVRRTAWLAVTHDACTDDMLVHEDQDLSLLIAGIGSKIVVDNKLLITTNGQTYRYLPKLIHYALLYEKTKKRHVRRGTLRRDHVRRLGFFATLPGRIGACFTGFCLFLFAIFCFPIDMFALKVLKSKTWLD